MKGGANTRFAPYILSAYAVHLPVGTNLFRSAMLSSLSEREPTHAHTAAAIAAMLYGGMPQVTPLSSHGSHVFRLDFSDVSPKLIKIARRGHEAGLVREQQVLPVLTAHGLEVPLIEHTQKDTDGGVLFTTMPFVSGTWLPGVYQDQPATAQASHERAGHFLARLSAIPPQEVPCAVNETEIKGVKISVRDDLACWDELYLALNRHPRTSARLERLMRRAGELLEDKSAFVNGDGPEFLINGMSTFVAFDWDIGHAGHPLLDLAHHLVTAHSYFTSQHISQEKGDWRAWLLAGFLGGRPLTDEMREHLHVLGAYKLLTYAFWEGNVGTPAQEAAMSLIETQDAAFEAGTLNL